MKKKSHYLKEITGFFHRIPEEIDFEKVQYKGFIFHFLNHWLVIKTLPIGDKVTDDYTRTEYKELLRKAGMIDIND